jgi:hypothetical protein
VVLSAHIFTFVFYAFDEWAMAPKSYSYLQFLIRGMWIWDSDMKIMYVRAGRMAVGVLVACIPRLMAS